MRFLKRWSARLCRAVLISCFVSTAIALLPLAYRFPGVPIAVLIFLTWRLRFRRFGGWEYGTACWADLGTLARNGLFSNDGLILGRAAYTEPPPKLRSMLGLFWPFTRSDVAVTRFFEAFSRPGRIRRRLLRIKEFINLGTFGPAGSGKSVSVLIPNLLSYRFSCVVTDPKGELYATVARHRRRRLKHRCIVLDPFGITKDRSESLNPLDFIDHHAPDFLDQCRDLANMLVVRQGTEHEPHWNDSAEILITACIAFVCACEESRELRNLQTVRKILCSPDAFALAVKVMRQTEGFGGVIQRAGDQLANYRDKELAGVMTTVQRHISFLDSPPIQQNTCDSSFDPRELRSGRLTLFLVLPPERLVSLAPLMRMWLGTIIRVLTRGEASEKAPVLFLLDEAAQLQRLPIIEDAVTLMRGYGIRIWLFFQSIDQMQKCYGDRAATILDNLGIQQYFGFSASYSTAEEVSKRIGDMTLSLASESDTETENYPTEAGPHGPTPKSRSRSRGLSLSKIGRRLIRPEELLTLESLTQILFVKNAPPILADRVVWHADREFKRGGTGRQHGHAVGDTIKAACLVAACLFVCGAARYLATAPLPQLHATDSPDRPPLDMFSDFPPPRGTHRDTLPARQAYRPPYYQPPSVGGRGGRARFPY